jgi:hypothetical protein
MKDLVTEIEVVKALGPAAMNSDQTAVVLDLQGYNSACILLGIGVGGITFDSSNYIEFTARHSDDNITFSNLTIDDLDGSDKPASIVTSQDSKSSIKRLVAAHGTATQYQIGYIGNKRYLELDIEFTGTHGSATPISVAVIKGNGRLKPPAA